MRWFGIVLTSIVLLCWALSWARMAAVGPAWLNYGACLFLWACYSVEIAMARLATPSMEGSNVRPE